MANTRTNNNQQQGNQQEKITGNEINVALITGRIKRIDVRYSASDNALAIARYTVCCTDKHGCNYIDCVAFGSSAEFAEKYFEEGTRISVKGYWENNSWTDEKGVKHYGQQLHVEDHSFLESKGAFELYINAKADVNPEPAPAQTNSRRSGGNPFANNRR